MLSRITFIVLGVVTGVLMASTTGPAAPLAAGAVARLIERIGKTPYERYQTTDKFGRDVTFYMAQPPRAPAAQGAPAADKADVGTTHADAPAPIVPEVPPEVLKVPLVVFVQGSGCGSHFVKVGDKVGSTTGFPVIHDALKGRGRVMVVEKPGVEPFFQPRNPGGADEATELFKSEHTLDRWAEAVEASIRSALELPGIDPTRVLVMGHSEGGIVAARVAADEPRVTHVACLAGGGPTQLYDFIRMAREGGAEGHGTGESGSGGMFGHVSDDPAKRVQWVMDSWADIMKDPMSTEKSWLGHPYRRWSTFCATSPAEELSRSKARVYIAQGTRDESVEPSTGDMLAATLLAKGRDVTFNRVEAGDHGFFLPGEQAPGAPPAKDNGWNRVMTDVVEWFLDPAHR